MERDNNNTENRKRTRDGEDDQKKERHVSKKQETVVPYEKDPSYNIEKGYDQLCVDMGVFDFPWLKDGSVFDQANEFLEHEDIFAPRWHVGIAEENYLDRQYFDDQENEFEGDRSLTSFELDDFEPWDCVWGSVMDQPIDR